MAGKLCTLKKSRFLKFTILRSQLCLLTIVLKMTSWLPVPPGSSQWPWRVVTFTVGKGSLWKEVQALFYALFVLSAHMTPKIGIGSLLQMGRWSSEKLGKLPRVTQRLCGETGTQAGSVGLKVLFKSLSSTAGGSTGSGASKTLAVWQGEWGLTPACPRTQV